MSTYANRGMTLETIVTYSLDRYRIHGEAVITKQHTKFIPLRNRSGQVVNCKVEEKATVDFVGRCRDIPVAIETKNTNTNRIRFEEVQDHQCRFMEDWILEEKAASVVFVAFNNLDRFFAVPWECWRLGRKLWKEAGRTGEKCRRETVIWNGIPWKTPGKASVSPEELLPEWEVKRDARHGLAVLENIELYTGQKKDRNDT